MFYKAQKLASLGPLQTQGAGCSREQVKAELNLAYYILFSRSLSLAANSVSITEKSSSL